MLWYTGITQATCGGTSYFSTIGESLSHAMWMIPIRRFGFASQIWCTTAERPPVRYG
jgi:hypothetical protein